MKTARFKTRLVVALVALWNVAALFAQAAEPLRLHPDNPHYFLFRDKPTILITSGEHYGAVLNLDFNYVPYLDELRKNRFNQTRTFSGTYIEPADLSVEGVQLLGSTLSPLKPERYCSPWLRSSTPGAGDVGNKFDLTKWNPEYFTRLKDFIAQAGERGIVVEFVLFCIFYGEVGDETFWKLSPLKAGNNVQGIGTVPHQQALALKDPELTAVQEAFVRKIVAELKDFDNLYYEICNEPYTGVTREWNDRMVAVIVEVEKAFPHKHLIAQNIANGIQPDGSSKIRQPNPHVSVFNFHYSVPPDVVAMNYDLNKPIGDDETGFRGTADEPYRTEGWDFLIAGGAVYSNLDFTFSLTRPAGDGPSIFDKTGGGPKLRDQLRILKEFMDGLDFIKMKPNDAVIKTSRFAGPQAASPPVKPTARALAEPGKAYAIYLRGGDQAELVLDLPAGDYRAEWVNTKTGKIDKTEDLQTAGGDQTLKSPAYAEDIALRLMRKLKSDKSPRSE
ncbi:MAG: hypothetical protein L0Z50_35475 [Verrucomicrobiales bacterium]|nr:hypothetical protein [Verrucomicrobiales bacterium]